MYTSALQHSIIYVRQFWNDSITIPEETKLILVIPIGFGQTTNWTNNQVNFVNKIIVTEGNYGYLTKPGDRYTSTKGCYISDRYNEIYESPTGAPYIEWVNQTTLKTGANYGGYFIICFS